MLSGRTLNAPRVSGLVPQLVQWARIGSRAPAPKSVELLDVVKK